MKKQRVDEEGCSSEDKEMAAAELKKKKKKRKSGCDESDSQLIPKKKRRSEEATIKETVETKSSKKKKESKSKESVGLEDAELEPAERTVKKKHQKAKEETYPDKPDVAVAGDLGIDSVSKKKKGKKSNEEGVDSMDHEWNSDASVSNRTTSSAMKQQKKKSKKSKGSHSADDDMVESRIDRALDYLRKWQNDRKGWKFEKVKQMILLNAMYDVNKLPEADFEILLSYLDGLVGKGREKTLEEAEKKLNVMDEAEKEDQNEEEYERIRKVIQVLS